MSQLRTGTLPDGRLFTIEARLLPDGRLEAWIECTGQLASGIGLISPIVANGSSVEVHAWASTLTPLQIQHLIQNPTSEQRS